MNRNRERLYQTMNGFDDNTNSMVYLQVKGRNKLLKEIEETQRLENRKIDFEALHR